VTIKEFGLEDYEAVIALWEHAGLKRSRSDSRQAFEQMLKQDADLFLVACEGDDLIGTVLGRYDGLRGWVSRLAVDRRYRAQGVGKQLMQELERRLQAKGCPRVCLFIEPDNARVETFYQQFGYDRRELLLMEKWL